MNFTDDDNHDEELTSAAYPASGTVAAAPTPNLTVGSPSVTNNNPEPGEVFTLSATVTNTGDKDAPATTLWFYQSTDTTITTSDPSPGTEPVGALAAGATSPESKDVTAPRDGGHVLLRRVRGPGAERNEHNEQLLPVRAGHGDGSAESHGGVALGD